MANLDTTLIAALAFRGWFPIWLAILLGILACAAVVFVYLREAGRLPVWRRILLASVRALTLASILFLLLRPSLLQERSNDEARPVTLLIDNSQSMLSVDPRVDEADRNRAAIALDQSPSTTDNAEARPLIDNSKIDNATRLDLVKGVLTQPKLNLLPRLSEQGPLQIATFGQRRSPINSEQPEWTAKLDGSQTKTALIDATRGLLERDEAQLPTAIVLVTDGRDNASDDTVQQLAGLCREAGVPLEIYGVGQSTVGQVQIRSAITPDTLFVDDIVRVPVRYRIDGFTAVKVDIAVQLNGKTVAEKTVDATSGENLQADLSFVPTIEDSKLDQQTLTTTIRVNDGKRTYTDTLERSVSIVDRKIQVLVIESIPRWDFKFLQRALLRDRRVVARFFLTDADRAAMESGDPFIPEFPKTKAELFNYDLLILGDVDAAFFSKQQQEFIRDFVVDGGGLIQIAGRNNAPASYRGTVLADVLPIEFDAVPFAIDEGYTPAAYHQELTELGRRSPILALENDRDENLQTWKQLQDFYWFYPVKDLKPAAEALLTHPIRKTEVGDPMPLLAMHYYGKGLVLWVGFDETWRWRFNVADKYFGRFWSQATYVLGVTRSQGTKQAQLSLDTAEPKLGERGRIFARLYNSELQPLRTAQVPATLEQLDLAADDPLRSQRVVLQAIPGQPGDYLLPVSFGDVGRYRLSMGQSTDTATLDYRVTLQPNDERAKGGMNEKLLRSLAESTEGHFYREETLTELPNNVTRKLATVVERREILLWNWWSFGWIVALFAAEWFLRKFNGLS